MARKATAAPTAEVEHISLTKALSKEVQFKRFTVWLVGDTPLITHAWSEKARREMLEQLLKGRAVAAFSYPAQNHVERTGFAHQDDGLWTPA